MMMETTTNKDQIPDKLYFRIGDVAELLGVKPYVLRYWESEFPMINPQKSASGQRVYRRSDVETVLMIKHLLYEERYSIEGAKKRLKELRKDGELKDFKEEAVAAILGEEVMPSEAGSSRSLPQSSIDPFQIESPSPVSQKSEIKPEVRARIHELANELREITQKSIQDLFLY
jgi:DNA-binding transcriptional MerR regulator